MFEDTPGISLFLVIIALVPGVLVWWRGRAFARAMDDPALPERLLAAQKRHGAIFGFAIAVILIAAASATYWAVPLMIAGRVLAAYPLRRKLYDETWSLGGYMSFAGRLILGAWGFWITLGFLPNLAEAAGSYGWLVAAVLAVLLLVWNARYADVFRSLLRTAPIEDPVLINRFNSMVQASGIPIPRFERIDLAGGAIANAIALPSLRGSSVVFTDTLLARLDPDEIAAICAHEIAHLEHFNPRLLQRHNAVNQALIVLGALLAVAAHFAGQSFLVVPSAIWFVVLLVTVGLRARDRQRNETASDLRGVALCGDAEALARGLTKLYAFARVPRRFDIEFERRATHPSLARRLRDIREAAGSAPATLGAAATFAAADGRAAVTFQNDRLVWTEGDVATHSLSYGYLSELRLAAKTGAAASLVAVESGGRRWQIPLSPTDIARVQAVLDIVDGRLTAPPTPVVWPRIGRVVVACSVVFGFLMGQFAMAIAALVAFLQPSSALLTGAGAAAIAAAALSLRTYAAASADFRAGFAILLGALGCGMLALAHVSRNDTAPRRANLALSLLGILTAASVVILAMQGLDPVRLHQSARDIPSTAVLLIGMSAALATWRGRAARYASVPAAVLGAAAALAGSTAFLEAFGRDPFLGPSQPIAWKTVTAAPQSEFSIPFYTSVVRLSPGSRAVMTMSVRDEHDGDGDITPQWHVGRPGRTLVRVKAEDVVFVDDDRVLLLETGNDSAEVREVSVDAPDRVIWRQLVPGVSRSEDLWYRAETNSWRLLGFDEDGRIMRAEGRVGSEALQLTRWPSPATKSAWPQAIAASGSDALVVEMQYDTTFLQRTGLWRWSWLLHPGRIESRFRRISMDAVRDLGMTRFNVLCEGAALDDERLVCSAFDGTRTRFAVLDPASGHVAPVAWLPGRFTAASAASGGWISGWTDSQPVAINLGRREALRLAPAGADPVTQITAMDRTIAAIWFQENRCNVRLYPLGGS